jgi:hypothetical protein
MLKGIRIITTLVTTLLTSTTYTFFLSDKTAVRFSDHTSHYPNSPAFNLSPEFSLSDCQRQCQRDWHACATWGMSLFLHTVIPTSYPSVASFFLSYSFSVSFILPLLAIQILISVAEVHYTTFPPDTFGWDRFPVDDQYICASFQEYCWAVCDVREDLRRAVEES